MRRITVKAIFFAAGCLFAASGVQARTPAVFSTEHLLRLLIRQQALPLDVASPEKGCGIDTGEGKIKTLGDYLAHLTSSLIPDNGPAYVTSVCTPLKNRNGQACEVWFSTGAGTESPWRYGMQFQLDDDGQIDSRSLRCPGAP
jgi:hypothetical protein